MVYLRYFILLYLRYDRYGRYAEASIHAGLQRHTFVFQVWQV